MSGKSDGSTFNTEISADPSKFEQGFQRAVASATTSSAQIDAQFKKVGDAVSRVNSMILGFTAVLAGGGALKKFITDANDWNMTAGKMASQLGITTQQASVLNTALTRLGIDSDTYLGASQKLSKQVQSNAQAFEVLGVNVRDASGAYRPVTELMGEVNQKLIEIKNPIEQNIAGQQVYGKGWAEIRGILKLTTAQMAESEVRARQLGLIVGPEGVAMSKQYSMQMRDLGLVGKSIEMQFGNALLPVFTRIGSFMSQEGPQAGQVFALILEGIAFAAASTWLALKDMGDGIGALAAQAAALLSGDLEGFRAIGRAREAESAKNEAAYERMKSNFGKGASPSMPAAPDLTSGPRYKFKEKQEGGGAAPSRVGEWETRLAESKAALEKEGLLENQQREMSKAAQIAYWSDLRSREDTNAAEKQAIDRKVAELEIADIKESFQVKVKTLQAESEAYKNNFDEKLRIELAVQAMYQAGTKQFEESQKRVVGIRREAGQQAQQVAQLQADAERQARLSVISLEEQTLKQAQALGLVSQAQVLVQEQQFEDRRTAILRSALEERLRLELASGDKDPAKVAQINAELEALEQGHQLRLTKIKGDQQANQLEPLVNTYKAAEAALGNAINGILTRTMSLGQAMRSVWQSISGSIIGEISKILAKKAAAWAVEKGMALMSIGANATVAGSGAAASVASIPYVGPILAIAALASVMAAVMGSKSSVPSAYAGYDIPAGLNPMTQLHEREMVLPAKHADVIRAMSEGQGAAQGGGGGSVINLVGHPMPNNFFMVNRDHLVQALKSAQRDNAWRP